MNSDVSVGDIVLYNHGVHETVMVSDQPLAAIVTYVHAEIPSNDPDVRPVARVNLAVFGKNGDQWQKHTVNLWDGSGVAPEGRLAFAYPLGVDPFAELPEAPIDAENDGVPADPGSDVVPKSTRGPNKLSASARGDNPWLNGRKPTEEEFLKQSYMEAKADHDASPVGDVPEWNGDAPSAIDANWARSSPLVNPPIGPEYKPNADHPMPNAPEPINKVPSSSPANPDRPLD